jgi:hypothetical protein
MEGFGGSRISIFDTMDLINYYKRPGEVIQKRNISKSELE